MAGSQRKSKAAATSYQEVDSDIDMQWDERLVQAKKAAATGKKKSGKSKKGQRKRAPLDLFVKQPFDVFSEVCSHLEPMDLVNLSRTNKLFRGLLSSRAARPIWTRFRTEVGGEALDYVEESTYVRLLFTRSCSGCHKEQPTKLLWGALTRLCLTCRKRLLIAQHKVRSAMPHLHPETTKAAHFTYNGPTMGDHTAKSLRRHYHLRTELESLSFKLYELQDEDELREFARPTKRSKGTRSRPVEVVQEEESSVTDFVNKRQAFVQKPHQDTESVRKVVSKHEAALEERWRAKYASRESSEDGKRLESYKESLTQLGWTDKQFRMLQNGYIRGSCKLPVSAPDDQPSAWAKLHKQIADRYARIQANVTNYQQKCEAEDALEEVHKTLLEEQEDGRQKLTFPHLRDFVDLPHVKRFWEGGQKVDTALWEGERDAVLEDVEEYRETTRVQAIRLILSATLDVPLSTLSTRLSDYPSDVYDDAFFSRVTSLFIKEHYSPVRTRWGRYESSITYLAEPFPDALALHYSWNPPLRDFIGSRQTLVLRAIIEAAGLDEETATAQDLDDLGARFRWLEHRGKGTSKRCWEWKPLVVNIVDRMPKKQKTHVAPTIVLEEMADGEEYSDEDELDGDEE